ncbi:response regulator transcription factor [Chelatococcus reniformis]|uniref:DNA-binding response regulator n=1 Tax=Chelatococcus reniformis TaxID=1494448 RepID=A0A916UQE1_9HYPH|nr:response regulator transcription factor [Chelatococcus reniformis]GGC81963.1 DNA-binding response regulator [Chelatococcus reniformis]
MSASPVRILVVDDEPPIRKLLRTGLGTQGYEVVEAGTGRHAEEAMTSTPPDLVILDLGLPDVAGSTLLKQWRERGIATPVMVLSSRTDEAGIVEALELGADDYVTKPFGTKELVARIRVALRHSFQQHGEKPVFKVCDLTVDLVRRLVHSRAEEVKLTPREYDILRVFVQHAGKVLTHQFLIRQVWGGSADVQNLRVHVRQLRQKIEADPEQPQLILTETGVGYRLRAPE